MGFFPKRGECGGVGGFTQFPLIFLRIYNPKITLRLNTSADDHHILDQQKNSLTLVTIDMIATLIKIIVVMIMMMMTMMMMIAMMMMTAAGCTAFLPWAAFVKCHRGAKFTFTNDSTPAPLHYITLYIALHYIDILHCITRH